MPGEEEVKSVQEYLGLIKKYKQRNTEKGNDEDFLFRGQKDDSPLIPKIARLSPRGSLPEIEKLLLAEFKRTNPLLLESLRPYDDWDYLTLGQHFGLPTRLLDWSINALTALWFATNTKYVREEAKNYSYGVVWVLMAEQGDFIEAIADTHPLQIKETKIFRPRIIKQRINNQSGMFSIHPTDEMLNKKRFDESEDFQKKLLKIKVHSQYFNEISTDLNTLGVNGFTIFPELEGLCSYLEWRYFC